MSNSFILVATVTPKNINWNIQFSEAVDVAVTEVIRKAVNQMNSAYEGMLITPQLKLMMGNWMWKVVRDNKLDCVALEWKHQ